MSAAKEHIPLKRTTKPTPWLSQDVISLADERRQLKEAGLQHSKLYRKLSNEIQQVARRDKNNHINELCEALENHSAQNDSRRLFKRV